MLLQQIWVSPRWTWQSLGKSFIFFVFLMLQAADLEARRGHQFVWKTGRNEMCWFIYWILPEFENEVLLPLCCFRSVRIGTCETFGKLCVCTDICD